MTTTQSSSPQRVAHRIRSVSVTGGFLDGARLEFADGLNCLIGGRGTGKTTVLELIRFALDAMPSRENDGDEWRRIDSLIEQNLAGGRVQVEFQTKNGLRYVASRAWDEEPVVFTTDGQPTPLTLRSGSVFRADIFSQNEVERIADLSTSQLVLIDKFHADDIADIEAHLQKLEQALAAAATQLLSLETQRTALEEELATLPEVEEKLKAFAGAGGEDAEAINEAHALKGLRDRERHAIDRLESAIGDYQEHLRTNSGWLVEAGTSHLPHELLTGPNAAILATFMNQLEVDGQAVDALLRQIDDQLSHTRNRLEQLNETIGVAHRQQEMKFRALIEKHESAMEQATERAQLERLRNQLLGKQRTLLETNGRLGELRNQRDRMLEELSELRDQRFALRSEAVQRINSNVSQLIRVRLVQFGEVGDYHHMLVNALRSAGIQHNVVAQKIATSLPPRELSALVTSRDPPELARVAGINLLQAGKTIEALGDRAVLLALETVDLDDKPRIELKDGDTHKDSLTLSTGQKCTSILPILLLDSDRPLLVDQPEDNLDNGFIYETVVQRLQDVKQKRQLILVTHNPNIPVLGDAAKVFVFKSSGTKAWIEREGPVDECRTHIITLLEGGEEAFRLRKERYNF